MDKKKRREVLRYLFNKDKKDGIYSFYGILNDLKDTVTFNELDVILRDIKDEGIVDNIKYADNVMFYFQLSKKGKEMASNKFKFKLKKGYGIAKTIRKEIKDWYK